jgi:pimeloyl-ACP methyl ester carboxylesterase
MRVIFSHGHLSSPQSRKIQVLAPVAESLGLATEAIDYTDLQDDPVGRIERLKARLAGLDEPAVLVGSSLGGLVSLIAAETHPVCGLFLMAPALYMEDRVPGQVIRARYAPRCSSIAVVHGWDDDVCPWDGSVRFANDHRAALHLLNADHRLDGALPDIKGLLKRFLDRVNRLRSGVPLTR